MSDLSGMTVDELRKMQEQVTDGYFEGEGVEPFDELARRLAEARREIERMLPVVEQACSDAEHWRIHGYVYSMDDLSDCCAEYERFKKRRNDETTL